MMPYSSNKSNCSTSLELKTGHIPGIACFYLIQFVAIQYFMKCCIDGEWRRAARVLYALYWAGAVPSLGAPEPELRHIYSHWAVSYTVCVYYTVQLCGLFVPALHKWQSQRKKYQYVSDSYCTWLLNTVILFCISLSIRNQSSTAPPWTNSRIFRSNL
jgi:hypothetical protein